MSSSSSGLRDEGIALLIGTMVCLLAAPWVHIMRCGTIGYQLPHPRL